ncbi:TadE/TadG family type IV pilus assembly protein [Thalassoglobus polymorphus]|uniref:TadE-like protein n=1 Tax=Thalassoglobus polymorphus TaxID=2527994 RepID=A0A517QM96_9PLAN|nr:TadE family protein [Thalassoglobus polymorphus]QDT32756.1 hypothetical protein Mal48_20030 [Thalassoglobus polymorphus]
MLRVRQHNRSTSGHERSGSVTLEFIIAFPIVFIAGLAIVEFFFLILVIEGGTTALHEGTRKAAELYPSTFPLDLAGDDDDIADKVVAVINQHLNVYNIEVVDSANGLATDDPKKQNATVIIERNGMTVTRPAGGSLNQSGNVIGCSRTGPPPDIDEVVVTLCFEFVDSADPSGIDGPVPDWLASFGFSLAGSKFEMTSRASLE